MADAGVKINVLMFVFNLFPLPPLDGGRILVGLLPMRQAVADILGTPVGRVSIKATTTEGMGFTGRGEGLLAQAAAVVELPSDDFAD
jgi:Zn-dependent protease